MMKELSLHIMDIVQNSISAKASHILIRIEEKIKENKFIITIEDNGIGMDSDFLDEVRNPFKTTRITRKVGLGIPMLEQTCEQCGGFLDIKSQKNQGTKLYALMEYDNIDRPPLGNIIDTIHILFIMNEEIDFLYIHEIDDKLFEMNTKEIKEILGNVSLKENEISSWLKSSLTEGLSEIKH